MIMVDVMIPVTGEVSDFFVRDDLAVGEVKKEVLKLIKAKNPHYCIKEDELSFYAYFREQLLDEGMSFMEQGVGNGEKLILI